MKVSSTYLVAALLAVALATGCGKSSSGGGLSVSARASAVSAAATPDGLALPDGITISRIRMAVEEVSAEDPQTCPTVAPVADDHGGCREFSFGPFHVDLSGSALDGSVDFAFDAPIPAGTYHEVSIKIDTVPANRAGDDPVLQDLAAAHSSILVDGFVETAPSTVRPFTFSAPLEIAQKREGAIVVGSGSNVTLDFDPSHWFDGAGGRLDPSDPSAQGAILANIRASIRILKDDDHDGREDDDEGPGHP